MACTLSLTFNLQQCPSISFYGEKCHFFGGKKEFQWGWGEHKNDVHHICHDYTHSNYCTNF